MDSIGDTNRKVFEKKNIVRDYAYLDYITDAENEISERYVGYYVNKCVLDLGVGGGRTTHWLAPRAGSYVGIDYSEAMVRTCRTNFPHCRIEQGDARDLSRFASESFDFILFSYNGIDFVGHVDRQRILREVARVLSPGGVFVFSTHRMGAPTPRSVLYDLDWRLCLNPLRAVKYAGHVALRILNYCRRASQETEADGYEVRLDLAYDFALPIYYITELEQRNQLAAAGLCLREEPLPEYLPPPFPPIPYSHYFIAQKPFRSSDS